MIYISFWVVIAIMISAFWIGYGLHYILYRGAQEGAIIIEKSDDPEEMDKMIFQLATDLNEIYLMKNVRLKVIVKPREKNSSFSEDIT